MNIVEVIFSVSSNLNRVVDYEQNNVSIKIESNFHILYGKKKETHLAMHD